ncbi:hypothetical protein DH2020_038149 [Rehmannia glutinosa]|uniref:Kinesin-like protein n=1 Tax=Rehmannia glutinosa TaxID=99300 RepID=A0ABR0V0P3_REHGL
MEPNNHRDIGGGTGISTMDRQVKDYVRLNSSSISGNSDVFESTSSNNAKQRATLLEWLNGILPDLSLPINASDEKVRALLIDGSVLFFDIVLSLALRNRAENVQRFLSAMDEMGLPRFQAADLEKGSMKIVLDCLLTLKTHFTVNGERYNGSDANSRWKMLGERVGSVDGAPREEPFRQLSSPPFGEDKRKLVSDLKSQRALRSSPLMTGVVPVLPSFHVSNAPTQSLLSVVNGILDESIELKNGEIPHRVACLLRKVVQEIERRICTQAEHLRTSEKNKIEEKKKVEEHDIVRLVKEKDDLNKEKDALNKEKDELNQKIANLRQELETARRLCDEQSLKTRVEAGGAQQEFEDRSNKETLSLLTESRNRVKELEDRKRNRVKELEAFSESTSQQWNKKEHIYHIFTEFQLGALRELRFASQSIQQEIVRTQKSYSEDFGTLGTRIRALDDAAKNYYSLLAENQKLHNELQELKGNIRVYCRIRPFLPGQKGKQSIIEYIGENGELVVLNPAKQGKEGRRSFKFDKVYGPTSTQADVFSDTQPLIQSVLDGYNVCIFAYGQTGSGKTYTMTGPDGASEEEWGVNYRALNNLFSISQRRESTFTYEVSVQMVEIYNEQVRDLLSNDGSQKRYPLFDLVHLYSVVSIHVRGMDRKSGSSLRGSLHLVDLAGSERVDRSEVTGDRLKEAQHINKSLSALGDVIFALAQKNAHVPYRNSKLTQVLQSSLGGQAKTLMFVQLNPDATSYSETLSTLKFAERVSGVELGAAKSSKDGRDVRELMEQVASLKDTIAKKDEEIETLQLLKDPKSGGNSLRYGTPQGSLKLSAVKPSEQAAFDLDDYSQEADGSAETTPLPDETRQASGNIDKPISTSRVPRPPIKSARESPKGSTGLNKSFSGTNLSTRYSRRWQ